MSKATSFIVKDWIPKQLKSNPGKVNIFTGPDLNVQLMQQHNPEILQTGKLKIFSVVCLCLIYSNIILIAMMSFE